MSALNWLVRRVFDAIEAEGVRVRPGRASVGKFVPAELAAATVERFSSAPALGISDASSGEVES